MAKNILVTGGNSGIGLALCKLLVTGHGCHVYMGSRDVGRGRVHFSEGFARQNLALRRKYGLGYSTSIRYSTSIHGLLD